MHRKHSYTVRISWTGNTGTGTSAYRAYDRSHEIAGAEKPVIAGSSDPVFHGDRTRWNPEELMVASLSACHQLWYLHLCADAGVVVEAYVDEAMGLMEEFADGSGQFTEVTLRPRVTLAAGSDRTQAHALHHAAHEKCPMARSVNFSVVCEPTFEVR